MIKSVTITNPKGEKLVLELSRPEKSGLIVQEITGLGPSKATINTTELATMDGSIYNSAKQENRNIVFTLGMMFAPTVEDSRQKTYKFFPIKKKIKMEFETTNRLVEIYGYVESNEPDIFSREESTQISVICPDPSFYDAIGSSKGFSLHEPLFEFPFPRKDAGDSFEIGAIHTDTMSNIDYDGDADCGVTITVQAIKPISSLSLANNDTGEVMVINMAIVQAITKGPFSDGDTIIINTVKGQKSVKLLRMGYYYNIIGAVTKSSDWFQLTTGENHFSYATNDNDNVVVTFFYKTAFGGI